jgi:hypothetical protein
MASLNGVITKLTQPQKDLLKTELQKPAYAGLGVGQVWKLLNNKSMIPNPVPQPMIQGSTIIQTSAIMDAVKWATVLDVGGKINYADKTKPKELKQAIAGQILFGNISIDVGLQVTKDAMADLVSEGALTQKQVDNINELTKIPDPTWQAEIPEQSRAEELLGNGWIVEGFDVRGIIT